MQMVEYIAGGGTSKRKMSTELAAEPSKPAKKKRIKQAARASSEDSDEDGKSEALKHNSDDDASGCETDSQEAGQGEGEQLQRRTKREAASVASKNIARVTKQSAVPDKNPVTRGTHDSEDDAPGPAKKKRVRKSRAADVGDDKKGSGSTSGAVGIKQKDLPKEEDLLHSEFVSFPYCVSFLA